MEVIFLLKRSLQLIFTLFGISAGYYFGPTFFEALQQSPLKFGEVSYPHYLGGIFGGIILFLVTFWLSNHVVNWIRWSEERLIKIPADDGLFGALGLIFGLIVAFLIQQPLSQLPIPGASSVLPFILSGLLGYLGFRVGYKKRDELISVFRMGRQSKDGRNKKEVRDTYEHKILDTSVIIDGRIADICKTGFLEGTLVIPSFVLEELQHIADSSDVLKRNRGRRGLDILNKIQKELNNVKVMIYEGDFEEVVEVDSKLVKLAKVLTGKVVTNDFNLNKVCELQGVLVLNINDLANAVKPVVLPGEEINVQVIKDGKEHRQGIAYLDDGTMIVIEDGQDYIGDHIDVLVTSVLQTSAGRMIFAKPKLLEKAL
jgi:uncharacterized protein YacL